MASCPNNPVLGRNLTDNFDFNETTKQIVPKSGTDTKPGALALNLGNNLPGDTTNATDALTAAGFNAMAAAPDTTEPLCGNEIQQAVTAAVAQSIGCDADAQEAIACAIASNPDAIACLAAALPSGGAELTGSASLHVIDANGITNLLAITVSDTGSTVLATYDGNNDPRGRLISDHQNSGRFVGQSSGNVIVFDPASNTYTSKANTPEITESAAWVVNHSGTAVATRSIFNPSPGSFLHKLAADGTLSDRITASVYVNHPNSFWLADDNYMGQNVNTGAVGTLTNFPAVNGIYAVSHDYSKLATAEIKVSANGPNLPLFSIKITTYDIVRTGDNFEFVQTATANYTDYNFLTGNTSAQGLTWSRDGTHLISCVQTYSGTPQIQRGISQVFNVSGGTITRDLGGVLAWGTSAYLTAPVVSLDGNYMIAEATEYRETTIQPYRNSISLFKRSGSKYFQIASYPGKQGMFIQGAGGARSIGGI